MPDPKSFFASLSAEDIDKIRQAGTRRQYARDQLVFAQGDAGDSFYVIDQGRVRVHCEVNGQPKQLCVLGSGDYFGELGVLNDDKRSASVTALEDSTLLCLDRNSFIELTRRHPVLGQRINDVLASRGEELILRETLCDAMGVRGENLYVSIKGDPSLRESIFSRERYLSPMDRILEDLQPRLLDLVINRSVFHIVVNFNSSEIRLRTVFDPFREQVHTADRLIDQAYIERHFTEARYDEKLELIRSTYEFISHSRLFGLLPEAWKNILNKSRQQSKPLARAEVENVLSHLVELRNVPQLYLRNLGVNLVQDAIRLQFNCDGTHIVSTEEYQNFINANFTFE